MRHPRLLLCAALAVLGLANAPAPADTAVGDWGHFMDNRPRIHLNNPDGRAFAVTVHVMQWARPQWDRSEMKLTLTGPDGNALHEGKFDVDDNQITLRVDDAAPGVYTLEPGRLVWVSSTLDQSVLWTGNIGGNAFEDRRAIFQPVVPRRWWFYVPDDVTEFTVRAQRADRKMSQREKWGISIFDPRGQRTNILWGQPTALNIKRGEYRAEMVQHVDVLPGTGGRFWSMEMRLGDGHNYAKPNVAFEHIPPYIARSPEEWFNPETGTRPAAKVYDKDPFIQSGRIEPMMSERWPGLQHFMPSPSLGDPDGHAVLGDGRFAMWNPDGRDLGYRIGTYLSRFDNDNPEMAQVRIDGPAGRAILDKKMPMEHIHHESGTPTDTLAGRPGVWRGQVTGVERWITYTYPATPLVLIGEPLEGAPDAHRFRLSAGSARNWYFLVPENTTQFTVRAAADHETDVMKLEVRSPDRTLALVYDNQGQHNVTVPEGLDGKIWHLRLDVGSATRMVTHIGRDTRYQDISLTLELEGVPGYLAPTWEQWFDPETPQPR